MEGGQKFLNLVLVWSAVTGRTSLQPSRILSVTSNVFTSKGSLILMHQKIECFLFCNTCLHVLRLVQKDPQFPATALCPSLHLEDSSSFYHEQVKWKEPTNEDTKLTDGLLKVMSHTLSLCFTFWMAWLTNVFNLSNSTTVINHIFLFSPNTVFIPQHFRSIRASTT